MRFHRRIALTLAGGSSALAFVAKRGGGRFDGLEFRDPALVPGVETVDADALSAASPVRTRANALQALAFASRTVVGWGPAQLVDVVRGGLASLRSGHHFGGETCLADNVTASQISDATVPTASSAFYYLVRGLCGGWGSLQRDGEIVGCP